MAEAGPNRAYRRAKLRGQPKESHPKPYGHWKL